MGKKEPSKGREWERHRRDRLNQSFTELAKILPDYNPAVVISKMAILEKATKCIRELKQRNQELISGNIASEQTKIIEELEKQNDTLTISNQQLTKLLKTAGITAPAGIAPLGKRKLKWTNRLAAEDVENVAVQPAKQKKVLRKSKAKKTALISRQVPVKSSKPSQVPLVANENLSPVVAVKPQQILVVSKPATKVTPVFSTVQQSGSIVMTKSLLLNTPIMATGLQTIRPSVPTASQTFLLTNGQLVSLLPSNPIPVAKSPSRLIVAKAPQAKIAIRPLPRSTTVKKKVKKKKPKITKTTAVTAVSSSGNTIPTTDKEATVSTATRTSTYSIAALCEIEKSVNTETPCEKENPKEKPPEEAKSPDKSKSDEYPLSTNNLVSDLLEKSDVGNMPLPNLEAPCLLDMNDDSRNSSTMNNGLNLPLILSVSASFGDVLHLPSPKSVEAVSPTAIFLSNFPIVSSSVTKPTESMSETVSGNILHLEAGDLMRQNEDVYTAKDTSEHGKSGYNHYTWEQPCTSNNGQRDKEPSKSSQISVNSSLNSSYFCPAVSSAEETYSYVPVSSSSATKNSFMIQTMLPNDSCKGTNDQNQMYSYATAAPEDNIDKRTADCSSRMKTNNFPLNFPSFSSATWTDSSQAKTYTSHDSMLSEQPQNRKKDTLVHSSMQDSSQMTKKSTVSDYIMQDNNQLSKTAMSDYNLLGDSSQMAKKSLLPDYTLLTDSSPSVQKSLEPDYNHSWQMPQLKPAPTKTAKPKLSVNWMTNSVSSSSTYTSPSAVLQNSTASGTGNSFNLVSVAFSTNQTTPSLPPPPPPPPPSQTVEFAQSYKPQQKIAPPSHQWSSTFLSPKSNDYSTFVPSDFSEHSNYSEQLTGMDNSSHFIQQDSNKCRKDLKNRPQQNKVKSTSHFLSVSQLVSDNSKRPKVQVQSNKCDKRQKYNYNYQQNQSYNNSVVQTPTTYNNFSSYPTHSNSYTAPPILPNICYPTNESVDTNAFAPACPQWTAKPHLDLNTDSNQHTDAEKRPIIPPFIPTPIEDATASSPFLPNTFHSQSFYTSYGSGRSHTNTNLLPETQFQRSSNFATASSSQSGGNAVTNFNLSTIFPEINDKALNKSGQQQLQNNVRGSSLLLRPDYRTVPPTSNTTCLPSLHSNMSVNNLLGHHSSSEMGLGLNNSMSFPTPGIGSVVPSLPFAMQEHH